MILNLCLKLTDLSEAELEALQQAVAIEKRRRQCPQHAAVESPPRPEMRVNAVPMPPAIIPAVQRLNTSDFADPWLTSSKGA